MRRIGDRSEEFGIARRPTHVLGRAHSDEAGRSFRFEAGHNSDLKPAAIPI
jgi:hypothetical protein